MNAQPPKYYAPIPIEAEQAAKVVLNASFKVHSKLGPGLLETVYETCLFYEIQKQGLPVARQVCVPIVYDGVEFDAELRLDLLVDHCLIVEIKAVQEMNPLFESQLLTYLKFTGNRLGSLINFNVPHLKNGIKRLVV